MRLHYYPETDSLYIDLDSEGGLVGIDIDHASQIVNLSSLETEALPVAPTSPSH